MKGKWALQYEIYVSKQTQLSDLEKHRAGDEPSVCFYTLRNINALLIISDIHDGRIQVYARTVP